MILSHKQRRVKRENTHRENVGYAVGGVSHFRESREHFKTTVETPLEVLKVSVSLPMSRLFNALMFLSVTGRVTIGAGRDVDITVQGTGVEPVHCHIDNSNGVVTLHPVGEMTSVDGLRVTSATRLTQGPSHFSPPYLVNVPAFRPGTHFTLYSAYTGHQGCLDTHTLPGHLGPTNTR